MALTFELGPSSATAIQLYPEWDYSKKVIKNESEMRTLSGRQYKYKWGSYAEIEFSLEWVEPSDAAVVNSWFESNTDLLFFVTSSTATEVNSVRIQGDETPLSEYVEPYDNYFKGKIKLASY